MPIAAFSAMEPKPGQLLTGPDYYRSSHSGHQPVLYRATKGDKPFVVCRLVDLDEAKQLMAQPHPSLRTAKSILGHPIHLFAKCESAVTKFRAMCLAQIEANRKMHERHLLTQRAR